MYTTDGMRVNFSYGTNPFEPEEGNLWTVSGNMRNRYEPDSYVLSEVELNDVVKYFRWTLFFEFSSLLAEKSDEPALDFDNIME